jgi:WD40 repeat protein
VYDLATGESQVIGPKVDGFRALCFTTDNRRLFTLDESWSQIRCWDLETQSAIALGDEADTTALELAYSPDGRWLAASGSDREVTLRLWNMETLEQVAGFNKADRKSKRPESSGAPWNFHITCLRFSPDGRELFGVVESEVRAWSIPDGKLARKIPIGAAGVAIPLPDGKHLATGFWAENSDVVIWDAKSGEKIRSLQDHWQPVIAVAASPFGSVLASGSRDHTVVLWDLRNWQRGRVLEGATEEIERVAVSADGARVAAGTQSSALLWDAESGKSLLRAALPIFWRRVLEFSPDGKILAVGDTQLRLFDATSGNELKRVQALERPVAALAFAPDGRQLAMASLDGTIWLWDVNRLLDSGKK